MILINLMTFLLGQKKKNVFVSLCKDLKKFDSLESRKGRTKEKKSIVCTGSRII